MTRPIGDNDARASLAHSRRAPVRKPMFRVRRRFLIVLALAAIAWIASLARFVVMPGESFRGALPVATQEQRELAVELERDVTVLARDIGERNTHALHALGNARRFIATQLDEAGHAAREETWSAGGVEYANVIAELSGSSEIVVVGAHYDSAVGCPAANDNASGVAVLLALARRMASTKPERTLRFVAFANEEPPFFGSDDMGSAHHARGCRARDENVVVMLSLEMLGCYSDAPNSQTYPLPLMSAIYPTSADFVAFVGDTGSWSHVRDAVRTFRATTAFPCEGAALPRFVDGAASSDHLSFWNAGYPALMASDTAYFRYRWYHTPQDTPERLDYSRMARVVEGLQRVIEHWASAD
jgi:hypothetical protein